MKPLSTIDFTDGILRFGVKPAKFQRLNVFADVFQTKREHDRIAIMHILKRR